ncbi:hypothetical protein FGB62_10g13 [Gracilaria domingensis]|nr:hypothetical protein FGB62_10g13 [Gracilaria domingensis]
MRLTARARRAAAPRAAAAAAAARLSSRRTASAARRAARRAQASRAPRVRARRAAPSALAPPGRRGTPRLAVVVERPHAAAAAAAAAAAQNVERPLPLPAAPAAPAGRRRAAAAAAAGGAGARRVRQEPVPRRQAADGARRDVHGRGAAARAVHQLQAEAVPVERQVCRLPRHLRPGRRAVPAAADGVRRRQRALRPAGLLCVLAVRAVLRLRAARRVARPVRRPQRHGHAAERVPRQLPGARALRHLPRAAQAQVHHRAGRRARRGARGVAARVPAAQGLDLVRRRQGLAAPVVCEHGRQHRALPRPAHDHRVVRRREQLARVRRAGGRAGPAVSAARRGRRHVTLAARARAVALALM